MRIPAPEPNVLAVVVAVLALLAGCTRYSPTTPPVPGAVILTVDTGETFENPTDEQIRQVIATMEEGPDRDAFAILERSEMTYLQIAGDRRTGFIMEYQEGDLQHHFQSERTDHPVDDVVRALCAYRDGAVDWSQFGTWSPLVIGDAE